MAQVGNPLIDIDVSGHIEAESFDAPSSPAKESEIQPSSHPVSFSSEPEKPTKPQPAHLQTFATPAVRRIAKENNVDLSQVTGTGKDGRILKEDVLNYVKNPQAAATPASATSAPAQPASTPITQIVEDEIRPLSGIQRAMFKTMTKSLQIPHFGFKEEIIVDPMNLVRKQINEQLAHPSNPHAIKKISYMPIMIKALSVALKDYPVLNSQLLNGEDVSKAQLLYRGRHNIGIAMDTPGGLVVPNIKDVQNKSIIEIASELNRLQEAGKTNSISSADLRDGTISLSNIGIIGGTYLSPVVVSTEVCICAVGKIRKLPRFVTETDYLTGNEVEKVIPQNIMEMSWTADHRVIDGATMARFAVRWKSLLENPTSLLAELK
jgi:2-oxoisovalerate dehydrogenase E2 component (dihydrolipoyl transacylase)